MNDPETGNWITYNGETYNFKQLRSEIEATRTRGDRVQIRRSCCVLTEMGR